MFAKQHSGAGSPDQIDKMGGEVSFIITAFLATGYREWLAGGRSGPERDINRHTSKAQRVSPAPDPREKMALREALHIVGFDFEDGSAVDFTGSWEERESEKMSLWSSSLCRK